MEETKIYSYYMFGFNFNILCMTRPLEEKKSLEYLIEEYFDYLRNLNLKVTENASSELKSVLSEIKKLPANAEVDEKMAQRVREACSKVDRTLDSELQLRTAYVVTPKRFDLQHLLHSPWKLVDPAAIKMLPKLVGFDFSSGCRCIAFALPTAAAFHFMRATEGMLRYYYCSIVKRGRVSQLMWNDMCEHLRKRRGGPPKALLDHLDNIRFNFRNPTQHPDARYSLEEAQDLLAIVIDSTNRMARDLADRVV